MWKAEQGMHPHVLLPTRTLSLSSWWGFWAVPQPAKLIYLCRPWQQLVGCGETEWKITFMVRGSGLQPQSLVISLLCLQFLQAQL